MALNPLLPLAAIDPRYVTQVDTPFESASKATVLAERQQQLADLRDQAQARVNLRAALQQTGGDIEKAIPLVMQTNPAIGLKMRESLLQSQAMQFKLQQAKLDHDTAVAEYVGRTVGSATNQHEHDLAMAGLDQVGIPKTGIDPAWSQEQTDRLNRQAMSITDKIHTAREKMLEEQETRKAADAQAAQERMAAAAAETARHNQALEAASGSSNERIAAANAEAARHNRAMEARQAAEKVSGAVDERSYQAGQRRLDAERKPIAAQLERLDRLESAINARTPTADALIAPELLTVMAGGQGSGLRMNEAEISRIVGGRSKFETLKATLNQWSLDPTKALSVTDEQRSEMRSLMREVRDRSRVKIGIIDNASNAIAETPDVVKRRKLVTDALSDALTPNAPKAGAPAEAATTGPNLQGLAAGHKRTFDTGSYAGQVWTIGADGQPKRLK